MVKERVGKGTYQKGKVTYTKRKEHMLNVNREIIRGEHGTLLAPGKGPSPEMQKGTYRERKRVSITHEKGQSSEGKWH